MASLALAPQDERMLSGRDGEARRLAMRVIVGAAQAAGAERLLDVASAHVDSSLYLGRVSLDFAERLARSAARVAVPTTLNVGSVDLLHPGLYRGRPETAERARRLMDLYVAMGCRPSWTCAPYQLPSRPRLGEHIAWAESNAVVFANSVLGARTDRYGDFIDVCAAITGRAPHAGLHRDENRRGRIVFRSAGLSNRLLVRDVVYPVLGHLVGREAGTSVPVLDGLPRTVGEDQLKALGAAAASSGAVGMFHAVGLTPEAPTLEAALGGVAPVRTVEVTMDRLVAARDSLSTAPGAEIGAVSLGTPHYSITQFARLTDLVEGMQTHPGVEFFVSTGRHVLAEVEARGWLEVYRRAGITVVVDTCTYITPMIRPGVGAVMTDSAKWAYYAPGNLGVGVVFGSTEECVRSAAEGRVWRDPGLWAG